jgi:hypothetical protein
MKDYYLRMYINKLQVDKLDQIIRTAPLFKLINLLMELELEYPPLNLN